MLDYRNKLQQLVLLVLMLLASGCASPPCDTPAPRVTAPRIPPLPQEAIQPHAPQWCSPTCSHGLMLERESWRKHMIERR